jgi:hypothetical protein
MRLGLEPDQQAFSDARLADAGLAGEQHDPPLAEFGLIPAAQQQFDLLPPANECRLRVRTTGLEAARTGQSRDRCQARRLARSWKIEPMKSRLVRAASSDVMPDGS